MNKEFTKQSLPKEDYLILLGTALSVFSSNNGFIIENIIETENKYDWYELIDKESGCLKPYIEQSITQKTRDSVICNLFLDIVKMRNRIIHGFRITSKNGDQILATKTRKKDGNIQFEITTEYLIDFIKKNDRLSDLLNKYRQSINSR